MSQQDPWPKGKDTIPELEHKPGECMWRLTVMAGRMDIYIQEAFEKFLVKTEKLLDK